MYIIPSGLMEHQWTAILSDEFGECAWICSGCHQYIQIRPHLRTVRTLQCAVLGYIPLDKPPVNHVTSL